MNALERSILACMHVASMARQDPRNAVRERHLLSETEADLAIDGLVQSGLVGDDRSTLTDLGRGAVMVVLAGGVFDIIHPGHIHTLNAARALGDVLVVAVATDSTAVRMKKRRPLHSQEQRQELVNSLTMVDLAIIGHEDDIFRTVDVVRPQIIALGYDQIHQEQFISNGCKKISLDVRVARLRSPIPKSSSSEIEKKYGASIYGI